MSSTKYRLRPPAETRYCQSPSLLLLSCAPRDLRPLGSLAPSYPDGPPANDFELMVAHLNNQSFPSSSYSQVDDIMVYSLFASKKNPLYLRRLQPAPALSMPHSTTSSGASSAGILPLSPSFTNFHATIIHRLCKENISEENRTCHDALAKTSALIAHSPGLEEIFTHDDIPVLTQ